MVRTIPKRKQARQAVLVTTQYRGVFFGYMSQSAKRTLPKEVRLTDARNCVSWDTSCRGFLGLANHGPTESCRIGPKADITLYDITSVSDIQPDARKRWEAAPWR